jgi:hypothetical protein
VGTKLRGNDLVRWAIEVCQEYREKNLLITLRQLYYQGVSREALPSGQAHYVEGAKQVNFFGFRSDCEAAARLYEVCARQIDAQCKAYLREYREKRRWAESGENLSMASDWKQSAVRGLAARFEGILEESRAEAGEEVQAAHALVLTRKQKVDDWVNATYTFGKGSSAAFGNGGWNADGFVAGKNLKLHDHAGLAGGATKAIA